MKWSLGKFKKQYVVKNYANKPGQVGRVKSVASDKKILAMPPGKRVSKKGKVYYERRANRSDKSHSKRF